MISGEEESWATETKGTHQHMNKPKSDTRRRCIMRSPLRSDPPLRGGFGWLRAHPLRLIAIRLLCRLDDGRFHGGYHGRNARANDRRCNKILKLQCRDATGAGEQATASQHNPEHTPPPTLHPHFWIPSFSAVQMPLIPGYRDAARFSSKKIAKSDANENPARYTRSGSTIGLLFEANTQPWSRQPPARLHHIPTRWNLVFISVQPNTNGKTSSKRDHNSCTSEDLVASSPPSTASDPDADSGVRRATNEQRLQY